jgi:hypothetical protein
MHSLRLLVPEVLKALNGSPYHEVRRHDDALGHHFSSPYVDLNVGGWAEEVAGLGTGLLK